jgi:hypothetical protein
MFESFLANFLDSRAAQFIKHIPREQLRVGVWRGEILLEDLELRADCLDGLGIPLTLEAGYVGNLRISIPWSSLGSKPVEAELDRVHLILKLKENVEAGSLDAAAEVSKQAAIMAAELAKRSNVSSTSPGWLTSLVNKLIKSFQVRVHNIHIRIEVDPEVSGGPSIAIGLVCQSMCSRTKKQSVPAEHVLQVCEMSVYWDRDVETTRLDHAGLAEVAKLFQTWGIAAKAESLPSVHADDDGDIFYVAPSDDGCSNSVQHHWVLQVLLLNLLALLVQK